MRNLKNTFTVEHLRVTASESRIVQDRKNIKLDKTLTFLPSNFLVAGITRTMRVSECLQVKYLEIAMKL